MPKPIKNFIAGNWSDAVDGIRFTSRNPADNRDLVAEAPLSGRAGARALILVKSRSNTALMGSPSAARASRTMAANAPVAILRDGRTQIGCSRLAHHNADLG